MAGDGVTDRDILSIATPLQSGIFPGVVDKEDTMHRILPHNAII